MYNRHHLVAFGVIAALVAWFFWPALSGESSFAFRDAAHFYHPLFQWMRGEWSAGQPPLWNPFENLGMPMAAENTPSIFYPGKLVFALPVDFALTYNLYIVGHVVLAAVTAYRLARWWSSSVPAAALAAMSYAFCGNVLFQYCNVVFLVGAAWLPWAIQLADRSLRTRSLPPAVGLGVVLAMMITGGDPQMAYNAMLLAGIDALLLWRAERRDRLSAAATVVSWTRRRPLLLAGAVVICSLLAAVQILPTLEASPRSARGAYDVPRNIYELASTIANPRDLDERLSWYSGLIGSVARGHQRQIYQFSVPLWRVVEFGWPNVLGQPFPTHRRWLSAFGLDANLWAPSMYMGILPVVLAVAAWSLRTKVPPEARFCSWMVLLGSLASLGMYGIAWAIGSIFGGWEVLGIGGEVGGLYWFMNVLLPGYVYFRYPAKVFVVAALGLSMLAARGWDAACQSPPPRLRHLLAALCVASLIGLGALAIGWRYVARTAEKSDPVDLVGPFDAAGAWWDIAGGLTQTAVLCALYWALFRRRDGRTSDLAVFAALLLTAADLAIAQGRLLLYAPVEDWKTEPPVVKLLPSDLANYRVFREHGPLAPSWRESSSRERYTEILKWYRATLFPKLELPYGISMVEAGATMIALDYETLLDVAKEYNLRHGQGRLYHPSVLDLLSARVAIVAETSKTDISPIAKLAEGMVMGTRGTACPRAWIVHEVEQLPALTGRAPWQVRERTREVFFPGGEPRDWHTVGVVESDAPLSPAVEPVVAGGQEHCKITRAELELVELDVQLASAGLVVLGDLDYPGWELEVETLGQSRTVPIMCTNRVMRGVAIPAGRHRLTYRYRPRSVFYGGAISGLTVGGLVVFAVALGIRNVRSRRQNAAALERKAAQI